jgi:hypothetical protein
MTFFRAESSSEPEELKVSPQDDIELVWVKLKTLGSNDLY